MSAAPDFVPSFLLLSFYTAFSRMNAFSCTSDRWDMTFSIFVMSANWKLTLCSQINTTPNTIQRTGLAFTDLFKACLLWKTLYLHVCRTDGHFMTHGTDSGERTWHIQCLVFMHVALIPRADSGSPRRLCLCFGRWLHSLYNQRQKTKALNPSLAC